MASILNMFNSSNPEQTRKKPSGHGKKIQVKNEESKGKKGSVTTDANENEEWFDAEGELAVDVYRDENGSIVVQALIAGLKPEDLDISLENDVVAIYGERKNPYEKEKKQYFTQECYWGSFSRHIILPEEIDVDKAGASMVNGTLTLTLPPLKKQQSKKIKVKS